MIMFLIEISECDDDDDAFNDDDGLMMMNLIKISEYDDEDVVDRKVKVLKILLLIERSKC